MLCKQTEWCTFCSRWQINGNRNWWFPFTRNKSPPEMANSLEAASSSASFLQISAPSLLATMWKTATAGPSQKLEDHQKYLSSELIAIYCADRLADQTSRRRTTSWRILLEAAQTLVRWAQCCTPSSSLSYRSAYVSWWSAYASLCQKWKRRERGENWFHRRGSLILCCRTSFNREGSLRWDPNFVKENFMTSIIWNIADIKSYLPLQK